MVVDRILKSTLHDSSSTTYLTILYDRQRPRTIVYLDKYTDPELTGSLGYYTRYNIHALYAIHLSPPNHLRLHVFFGIHYEKDTRDSL